MTVDSERQREILLNCIASCQLSGPVAELIPLIRDISGVTEAVKAASLVSDAVASGTESGLRIVSSE